MRDHDPRSPAPDTGRVAVPAGGPGAGWNGPEGRQWAGSWRRYDRLVEAYQRRLVAVAAPVAGRDVLDVGCGTGRLSRDLAPLARPGVVVGVDVSEPMVARARTLTARARLDNVELVVADAQRHRFPPGRFELVVSRFGLQFFDDPVAALLNLAAALGPGGRLVALTWRGLADNEWLSRITAACGPEGRPVGPPPGRPGVFGLADAELTTAWLAAAGFGSVVMEAWDEPLDFGPDLDTAFAFVTSLAPVRSLLAANEPADRPDRLAQLRAALAAAEGPAGVRLGSGCWLITAVAGGEISSTNTP